MNMAESDVMMTKAAEPNGQVFEQINLLRGVVESLNKNHAIFQKLLEPVTRLAEDYDGEAKDGPRDRMVPLAEDLHGVYESLRDLHHRFNELGDRISL